MSWSEEDSEPDRNSNSDSSSSGSSDSQSDDDWHSDSMSEEEEEEEEEESDYGDFEQSEESDHYSSSEHEDPSSTQHLSNKPSSDRISSLPDPILHHILSLRDMKEVVQTSIISRRFRTLWKSVPTLNFRLKKRFNRESQVESERKFIKFVDRVLLLRNEDANIEKLRFSCPNISDTNLYNWISVAQRRHVQELYLDIKPHSRRVLPKFVFVSEIKVFKLISVDQQVQVPKLMCSTPQLKSIVLHSAMLPRGDSKKELNISCTGLEDLRISNCEHEYIKTLCISAPLLRNLVLENQDAYGSHSGCKVRLFTPKLISLVLKGRPYKDYILEDLSCLVYAEFELDKRPVEARILNTVLKSLYNVTTLKVSGRSLKVSAESPDTLDLLLQPFSKLRCLRLLGFSDGSCVHPILKLLTNAPCVENLVLGINQIRMDEDWAELFQCIHRLKSIEIQGIEGSETELIFFEFVLDTAVVLEAFTVTAHKKFSLKTRKEQAKYNMKMHSLHRASSTVEILFLI